MTTTDRELSWIDPGYDHGAARRRALPVLHEVVAEIPDHVNITSAGIECSGGVRVQLDYDDARVLVDDLWGKCRPGDPVEVSHRHVEISDGGDQHYWTFTVDHVGVEIVGVER